ncbi:MAG: tol-pal system protein YbgF [Candidatus Hydrogenedentota bacterium]
MANTIYDMHRKVSRLDKDLGTTVEHLNETAADLSVRVNESNTQAREVQSMVEENQRKLEQMEGKLDALTRTLYEQFGITPPSGRPSTGWGASPEESYVVPGQVQVEPPKSGVEGETSSSGSSLAPEPDPLAHTTDTAPATSEAPETPQLDPVPAYNKAMEAYQRDQFEEALQLFSDFSKRYPDSEIADNAQFWQGECLYNLGRYEECIAEFEKLRNDFPDSAKVPYGMFNQAAAHLKLGQQARAFALLENLVENYPMTPAAARARSKLKEVQGN